MAIKTTLEQIEEVQAAITKVMAGQSATAGGITVTLANLAALERREEKLLTKYRAESGDVGPAPVEHVLRRDY